MRIAAAFIALTGSLATTAIGAPAGTEHGNGGDVVVCRAQPGGAIRSIELADYYEARVVRGINVDLGGAGLAWPARVELALKRLERVSPVRAERLRGESKTFFDETNLIPGNTFPDIPDTGGLIIPAGCAVEQIAIQQTPQFPQDKRYLFNADLWNALDEVSRAGLVLHEMLYREALRGGALNSVATRYLNSVIASHVIDGVSYLGFIDLLMAGGFLEADVAITLPDGHHWATTQKLGRADYGLGCQPGTCAPRIRWYAQRQGGSLEWEFHETWIKELYEVLSQSAFSEPSGGTIQLKPSGGFKFLTLVDSPSAFGSAWSGTFSWGSGSWKSPTGSTDFNFLGQNDLRWDFAPDGKFASVLTYRDVAYDNGPAYLNYAINFENAQGTLVLHPDVTLSFDKGGTMSGDGSETHFTKLISGSFTYSGKTWKVTRSCTGHNLQLNSRNGELFFEEYVYDPYHGAQTPDRKCYKIEKK